MYDLNDSIELILPVAEGDKSCVVKHPTDDQWISRFGKRYTIIRNLGNGVSETKSMNRETADSELLAAIQLNKEIKFDEAEAITLIEQLANCDVVDVTKEGGRYVIILNTPLGEVTLTVKIPTHKDLKYATEACLRVRGGKFNASTIHISLSPGAELFDKIAEEVKGYSTTNPKEIPIIHKYKAIDAIQGEVNQIVARSKTSGAEAFPSIPGPTTPA